MTRDVVKASVLQHLEFTIKKMYLHLAPGGKNRLIGRQKGETIGLHHRPEDAGVLVAGSPGEIAAIRRFHPDPQEMESSGLFGDLLLQDCSDERFDYPAVSHHLQEGGAHEFFKGDHCGDGIAGKREDGCMALQAEGGGSPGFVSTLQKRCSTPSSSSISLTRSRSPAETPAEVMSASAASPSANF